MFASRVAQPSRKSLPHPLDSLASLYQRLLQSLTPSSPRRRSPTGFGHSAHPAAVQTLETRALLAATPPFVMSIDRISNATITNNQALFTVTFNTNVTGVDATDFQIVKTANVFANSTPIVTQVSGSVYDVLVTGISGTGKIGLDLIANGSIKDVNGLSITNLGLSLQFPSGYVADPNISFLEAVTVGDLNNDGANDVVTEASVLARLLGNGDGTLQAETIVKSNANGPFNGSVAVADFNGDGILDIVDTQTNFQKDGVRVFFGSGLGNFPIESDVTGVSNVTAVKVGDFNGDKKPDLLLVSSSTSSAVILNNGNGIFGSPILIQGSYVSGLFQGDATINDFNGDGKMDVAQAGSNGIIVALGNGDGTFKPVQTYNAGNGTGYIESADVNCDGFVDLVSTGFFLNGVAVLLGKGDGTFSNAQTYAGSTSLEEFRIGDVDHDGYPDIVAVTFGGFKGVDIYRGNGDGTFQTPMNFTYAESPSDLELAEMNGDKGIDLVVAGGSQVFVQVNQSTGNHHSCRYNVDANTPPTDINLSNNTVLEAKPVGTQVGTFSSIDIDPNDTHTYTLVAGTGSADNASFTIDVAGNLLTGAIFNSYTKNSYSIRVRSTDSHNNFFEKSMTITVTHVNRSPTGINLSNNTISAEKPVGTLVGKLTTVDPDILDTFTYTLIPINGTLDHTKFTIDSQGNLRSTSVLFFNTQSVYNLRIQSTDQGDATGQNKLSTVQDFTINVLKVNHAPTDIFLSKYWIYEGQPVGSLVGNFTSFDPDTNDTFTYSLVAGSQGPDNSSFTLDPQGNLKTNSVFNYQAKNSYTVLVRTTDAGGLFTQRPFVITIASASGTPVLTGNSSPNFNVNPVAAGASLLVANSAKNTLSSATVTITNYLASDDRLAFTPNPATMGNISGSFNLNTGVMTLTSTGSTATLTQWQAALRAVTYSNVAVNRNTAPRFVAFQVNDGVNLSNVLTNTITITNLVNPPVLAGTSPAAFNQGQPAVVIDSAITVTDTSKATLASGTVRLTNYLAKDDRLVFTADAATMGNITGGFSTTTGVLTLTSVGATATLAQWQAALRAVKYNNVNATPNPAPRKAAFQVSDGVLLSNVLTNTITVTPTPGPAPVLAGVSTATYNSPTKVPVAINTGITVTDADSPTLVSATITLTNYLASNDRLGFVNIPASMGNITGTFSTTTGKLVLTSAGGTATLAQWQNALRAVTYFNVSLTPNKANRIATSTINDGTSNSNTITSTITLL